ncbi:MAG TPA: M23 family metallopeptidase [Thermoanaerobaculia bacterium]|nr:M23 family metallopeptidase [Thermoanaerobaculia bacterium]
MTGEKKKGSWKVPFAGLAGFALGAATVLLIVALYGNDHGNEDAPQPVASVPPPAASVPPPAVPAPAPAPAPPPARIPRTPQAIPGDLAQRDLLVPVQGIRPEDLQDTFDDARSEGRIHDAIDIMAPLNTPVLASEAGRIVKFFTSKQGGLTIYQYDPTETYCYYYAHLDSYAPGLKEGDTVARGQVIGYVGATGNASPEGPHLHFAINRLKPDKKWYEGDPINPYPVLQP